MEVNQQQVVVGPIVKKRSGPTCLFHDKVRSSVSITLTREHHYKVKKGTRRLGLTRADFIGLLVDLYADSVEIPTQ